MALKIVTGGTTGAADGTLVSSGNPLVIVALNTAVDAHIRCDDGYWSNDQSFDVPAQLEVSFDGGSTWYDNADEPITAPEIYAVNVPIKIRQTTAAASTSGSFVTDGTYTAIAALSTPTLTATVISATQIDLSWTNVANEDASPGYTLQRSTAADFSANLVTVTKDANVTTHSATGLSSATHYYFRVKAEGSGRYSDSGWGSDDDTTSVSRAFPSLLSGVQFDYHFQEGTGTSINDESSNNWDGTITAGSGAWGTTSPPGDALDSYYDFATSRIAVASPSSSRIGDNPGTIECVLKLDAISGAIQVIYREGTTAVGRMYFWITTDGKLLYGGANTLTAPSALSTGTWYYLAAAWDGSGIKLYQNGTEVATSGSSGLAAANDADQVNIGGRPTPDNDLYFDGKIAWLATSDAKASGATILSRAQTLGFA